MSEAPPNQSDKFKEAARQLECDEDTGHWDDALKKVVKPKTASSNQEAEKDGADGGT